MARIGVRFRTVAMRPVSGGLAQIVNLSAVKHWRREGGSVMLEEEIFSKMKPLMKPMMKTIWMKPICLALLVAASWTGAANAQLPTHGHVSGNAYVNTYFHFAYRWPANLKPGDLPALAATDPHAYEFLLFLARQGTQPYGVVLVAQKLSVAGPHSAAMKSSADLIDRIARSLRAGPVLSNIAKSEKKNARGMIFDELTYLQNGKPSAVLATKMGGYLIVFKCNAQSQGDIRTMENSALGIRLLK